MLKRIWSRFYLSAFLLAAIVMPYITFAAKKNDDGDSWFDQFGIFGEIMKWAVAIFLFIFFIFIAFLIAKLVATRVKKRNKYEIHKEVVILIERCVYFTIIILGAVIAFSIVGIDMTWILGPLTFGLGFAFRDLLANIIAGMVILTQKKFKIDDIIKVKGSMGRITNIEIRSTDVQSFDGTNLIVPNADMLTNVVQNYTANTFRRLSIRVGVHYSTPLPYAVETSMKAVKQHAQVVADPHPEVLTVEFGDSSITLEIRFWIESTIRWWAVQSEVIQLIKKEFDAAGITIPFPIRTLSLDPYDKNLLQSVNIDPDLNPSYQGYSAEDLKPNPPSVPVKKSGNDLEVAAGIVASKQ